MEVWKYALARCREVLTGLKTRPLFLALAGDFGVCQSGTKSGFDRKIQARIDVVASKPILSRRISARFNPNGSVTRSSSRLCRASTLRRQHERPLRPRDGGRRHLARRPSTTQLQRRGSQPSANLVIVIARSDRGRLHATDYIVHTHAGDGISFDPKRRTRLRSADMAPTSPLDCRPA